MCLCDSQVCFHILIHEGMCICTSSIVEEEELWYVNFKLLHKRCRSGSAKDPNTTVGASGHWSQHPDSCKISRTSGMSMDKWGKRHGYRVLCVLVNTVCTKESWAAGKFGAYWDIYFSVRNSGLEKMPSFEWHCFAFGCSCVSRSLLTKTNASIRPSWPLWQKIQSNRGRSSEEEVGYSGDTGNWTEEEERHFASQGRCRTYHLLPQK